MSKNTVAALIIAVISGSMIAYSVYFVNQQQHVTLQTRAAQIPTRFPTLTLATADTASASGTQIYLIAIEDNGKSGTKVGCGDSVVSVNRQNKTETIKAALTDLFSVKDRNYGQSGLYNSLYQSELKVKSVVLKNGIATIYLTGTITQGGVCDSPRIIAQLEGTAKQFSMVKETHFFLNSKPLTLSEKGE